MTASPELLNMLRQSGDGMPAVLRRLERHKLPKALEAALVEWIVHLRVSRALSVRTAENYMNAVALYALWLRKARDKAIDAAEPADVEAWMQYLFAQAGQKARTRGLKLTAIRRFYSWRLSMGKGRINPAADIQGPKRGKPLPKKYTEAQLRALFASCDRDKPIGIRDYSILMMFYATGARRDELEKLGLSQLVLREKGGEARFHGKGAKERVVRFGQSCSDAIKAWLYERDRMAAIHDEDAVWLGLAGHSIGKRFKRFGLYSVVARAIKRAGLRIDGRTGVHRLRVTFATDLFDSGAADLEAIQMLLGHESIETTRGYLAISERRQKARMPESQIRKITGDTGKVPLWLQHKQQEGDGAAGQE